MRARAAVVTAVLALGLSACGNDDRTDKDDVGMVSKVKLSEAVADYETFNDALVTRLDAELGAQSWTRVEETAIQSLCDGGKRAFLARREFRGSYDAASLAKVRDVVLAVGSDHGFGEPSLLLEKPGYLEVVASDETGGEYSFVASTKTSVVTSTGCHPVD